MMTLMWITRSMMRMMKEIRREMRMVLVTWRTRTTMLRMMGKMMMTGTSLALGWDLE